MENLCIVCLSTDRRLHQITTSISGLITMILPELEITKLCWECVAGMNRLYGLRNKALESKRILDEHLEETLTSPTFQIKTNLRRCQLFTFSLCDVVFDNEETTKVTKDNLNDTQMLPGNKSKNKEIIKDPGHERESVIVNICNDKIGLELNESTNGFRSRKKKVRSKKRDATLKQYVCSECKETFESRGKYEYHKQKHRGRVRCSICSRDFSCRSALNAHGSVAHSAKPLDSSFRCYCQPCGKFFKTECSYRKHMRTSSRHVDPETLCHPCPVCGKRFARPEVRDQHHRRVHMRRGRLQCARCCRQYCSVRALRCHIRRRHTPTVTRRDYMCEVCGVGFKTAQVLKGHQRTHAKKLEVKNNNNCSEVK